MINIPNIGVFEFSEDYWECCDVKTEAGYVEPSILISKNKETYIIYLLFNCSNNDNPICGVESRHQKIFDHSIEY